MNSDTELQRSEISIADPILANEVCSTFSIPGQVIPRLRYGVLLLVKNSVMTYSTVLKLIWLQLPLMNRESVCNGQTSDRFLIHSAYALI